MSRATDDSTALPFGALLQRHRVAAGLTQEALAERAGLSTRGLSDLERGARQTPQRETVRRQIQALGLGTGDAAALEAPVVRSCGPVARPGAQNERRRGTSVQEGSPGASAAIVGGPARLDVGVPAGTVTFLFTDLEGSTRLLEARPRAYREAVARHHALLRGAVEAHGGVVFETVGDAVYAAFTSTAGAVAAALTGQLALLAVDWGALGAGALRPRMALHTGEAEVQGAHLRAGSGGGRFRGDGRRAPRAR